MRSLKDIFHYLSVIKYDKRVKWVVEKEKKKNWMNKSRDIASSQSEEQKVSIS